MKLLGRALVFVALCACAVALPLFAQATKPDPAGRAPAPKDSTAIKLTAQQERGAKAYLAYCSMCHGEHGAGDGPVAPELARREGVRPAHLDEAARLEKIGARGVRDVIVRGGGHTGRSNLMPTWGEHLAPAVVDDIVAYVMVLPKLDPGIPPATLAKYMSAPAGTPAEGRKLFVTFCTACHGPQGKGDGFNADSLYARNHIRPRNLTETSYFAKKTDQDLYATIALGGGHNRQVDVHAGLDVPSRARADQAPGELRARDLEDEAAAVICCHDSNPRVDASQTFPSGATPIL
jgi:mono/diheme cytochrome c family protein